MGARKLKHGTVAVGDNLLIPGELQSFSTQFREHGPVLFQLPQAR